MCIVRVGGLLLLVVFVYTTPVVLRMIEYYRIAQRKLVYSVLGAGYDDMLIMMIMMTCSQTRLLLITINWALLTFLL